MFPAMGNGEDSKATQVEILGICLETHIHKKQQQSSPSPPFKIASSVESSPGAALKYIQLPMTHPRLAREATETCLNLFSVLRIISANQSDHFCNLL